MIIGTGVDIIEISRIKKSVETWGDRFLTRVLNPEEIAYAREHVVPFQHYAGRFAAKEAIYKAVGDKSLSWKELTITNTPEGKPVCKIAKKTFKGKIHLSISHSKYYAVASAVVEA